MSIFIDDRYRIKRNADQEEQMKYLIQDLKVFQSYSQILVVSAIIGYNNGAYVEIKKQASDTVLMNSFSQQSYDIMDFIAYARVKEQSILQKEDKYKIFESYANGGFPILLKELKVDFKDKNKNDRLIVLRNYFTALIYNSFKL